MFFILFIMFTGIAFDFTADSYYGSKKFSSLEDACLWVSQTVKDVPDSVDVWVQDPDGNDVIDTAY